MPDFLGRMRDLSRTRVKVAEGQTPRSEMRSMALSAPTPPRLRLSSDGFDIIAEFKRRAPSSGTIVADDEADLSLEDRVSAYALGGAAVVSVLTEPSAFHGSLGDLRTAARSVRLPIMRKDFVVDTYQVYEARANGAAGILVIVRLLSSAELEDVLEAVEEAGLFVLLEAFDRDDLELTATAASRARAAGIDTLVGLNARDLETLQTDRLRLNRYADDLPIHFPRVAESSLCTPEHAAEAARYGYGLALVGSALMRTSRPTELVSSMVAAGRAERATPCALA